MKPNLPTIHCAVTPIDILHYVTLYVTTDITIHSPVAAPDCEQHYWYIINDIPTHRNFDDIPHVLPAFLSYVIPRILHDPV